MHRRPRIALTAIAIFLFALAISPALAAAPPLELDTGFGNRGVVINAEAPLGFGEVNAMTVAPGRSIYVAAKSTRVPGLSPATVWIARYRRDGELEPSFGTKGYLMLPGFGPVNALAAGNSERLFVLSHGTTISRIAGGKLDPSFGTGGSVNTATLGLESFRLYSLVALPGGGVAAAGATSQAQMAVVKLRHDGTLDTSFDGTGFRLVSFGPHSTSGAFQLKVQDDGRLVLGGYAGMGPALARLLPDGTPDRKFGQNGRVVSPHRLRGRITALAVRRDGSILVGANGSTRRHANRALLLRYGPGGELDRGFGAVAAPASRSALKAIPIAAMRARRHIFLVLRNRGTAIRAYRLNGRPLDLGKVPGVPSDLSSHAAAVPQGRKLVLAWTPRFSPLSGEVDLARFVVR
ncbi:MAG TPA: hypothetical protein VF009_08225 [Solirubrobacterales bacterium]